MSAVGTIAAAATFVITGGNPQATMWAYQIGATTESLLFPPKGPDGPRLGELSVQVSSYGQSLPRSWGTTRRAGNIIWSADLVEKAHEQGGKGGPTQTTYSYTVSFAVSFGEGPISGFRRLWAGGKIIYDASVSNTGPTKDFTATSFTIYTGTETQGVDPTIQAAMTNAPAYRGQCYLVFTDLQLEKFGNRIPFDLQAEIVQSGSTSVPATVSIGSGEDNGALDPNTGYLWTVQAGDPQSTVYVNDPVTNTVIKTIVIEQNDGDRITYVPTTNEFWVSHDEPGLFDTDIAVLNASSMSLSRYIEWTAGASLWPGAIGYNSTADVVYVASTNGVAKGIWPVTTGGTVQTDIAGIDDWIFDIYDLPEAGIVATNGWPKNAFLINASNHQLIAKLTGTDFGNGAVRLAWDPTRRRIMMVSATTTTFCYVIDVDTLVITKTTMSPAPGSALDTIIYHPVVDKFIGTAGTQLVVINASTFAVESTFNQTVGARFISRQTGLDDAVLAVSADNVVRRMYFSQNRASQTQIPVSTIVTDLSVDVGLTAGDIDVTDLTGLLCDGFLLARQGSARSAIEQLMMAYQFDAVESGGKVKFVRRGIRPSTVIDADSLAVHEPGQDVPTALPLKRADEVELPRSITVKYMNLGADHQIGAQSSIRQTGRSVNDVTWELPIVMSDAHAKAIADAGLYSAWAARTTAPRFSTTLKFADKEPTDLVSVEGNLIRITKRTLRGNILDFEGALDSGQVFAAGAAAGAAQSVAQTIGFRSKTAIELMDIPLLRDQDNDAGFYVAASGYKGQTWDGCVIFKSNDGGGSWNEVATLTKAATAGAASTVLGDFAQNVFDESNTVTVVLRSGTLSSITELAVLNGGNVALLGSEIIQFRTATLNGDGSYTLSGLLRGRKGSPTSGHVIGDRFVLLNTTSVFRVDMSTAEIGLERLYKAVSIGDTLASARTIKFTNTAIGLECLSGVHLGGGRNAAGDVTINWTRRTRIGGEWRDYADVVVGETSESYEVEIWTSGYATLKRTITGLSTPTASYTSAQQVTDFGASQATVYTRVYQLSANVGRGFVLQGTV